ncbi:MAG TPA: stage III sporulation protein AD [Syntrophomonas sp.]|nr:stage III sporulation protein AD [Syntrophomonas sp.]HRW12393.1 stage III sporulation protein AD [Syntrophomonas sp.]
MEITQIVGLALMVTVFLLILRQEKPVMAVLLSIAFSIFIFLMMMDKMGTIINVMKELSRRAGINYFFMTTILKILGVAYLGEFAAVLCQDAGEQAVAKKVEFAAKIMIAVLALPIMAAILESLLELMPG